MAPVPNQSLPLYCVGLNYRDHAQEAKVCKNHVKLQHLNDICSVTQLNVPKNAPLWSKPASSLANPNEDIPLNKFCAESWPDYEGELVFVTDKKCRDLSPTEAEANILGYTAGNDISCRMQQLPENCGGQFFFAKGFDKFAPLGPTLISPETVKNSPESVKLTTRVNGEVRQETTPFENLIWSCAELLSRMSQGTTIPAGTAVMTGTCSGIGIFREPRAILKDGDVVEVEITGIGTLRNKIVCV